MSNIERSISPKVSVAMITYNHVAFIQQAIDSILKQDTTFTFELIIGEDFSTDSTRKICEGYAEKFPEIIKLLPTEKNLGVTPNFIRTLKACNGKYIATCEGDDYWTDSLKLQKQSDFLDKNSNYAACFHKVQVVDYTGKLIRESKSSFLQNQDLSALDLMKGRVLSLSTLCFRNIIPEYPQEFSKSPTGDNFLSSLIGNLGPAKFMDDIKPSSYRMHSNGMWSLQEKSQKRKILVLSYFWLWQYYQRIGKHDAADTFYKKIMLEGFYSNPFQDFGSPVIGKIEQNIVMLVRKFFRIVRRLLR
jgi:glycosyltransferase involved in cell wall biosynthesis